METFFLNEDINVRPFFEGNEFDDFTKDFLTEMAKEGLTVADFQKAISEFSNTKFESTPYLLQEDTQLVYKKSPSLKKCEALLGKYRKVMKEHKESSAKSKLLVQIRTEMEALLASQFGLMTVNLNLGDLVSVDQYIVRGGGGLTYLAKLLSGMFEINAFTIKDPLTNAKQLFSPWDNLFLERGPTSIRYKNHGGPAAYVYVAPSLLGSDSLSNGEVFSVILHEIGHNFYRGSLLARSMTVMSNMTHLVLVLAIKLSKIIGKLTNSAPVFKQIYEFFGTINAAINSMAGGFENFINKYIKAFPLIMGINNIVGFIIAFVLMLPKMLFGQMKGFLQMDGSAEEKFCDDFASIHGYGIEIASSTTKLRSVAASMTILDKKNIEMIKRARLGRVVPAEYDSLVTYSYLEEISELFLSGLTTFDPHPTNSIRGKHVIENLKRIRGMSKSKSEIEYINQQIKEIAKVSGKGGYNVISDSKAKEVAEMGIYSYLVGNLQVFEFVKELATDVFTLVNKIPGIRNLGATSASDLIKNL